MLILGRFREKGVLLVSWGEILDFGVLKNMKLKSEEIYRDFRPYESEFPPNSALIVP